MPSMIGTLENVPICFSRHLARDPRLPKLTEESTEASTDVDESVLSLLSTLPPGWPESLEAGTIHHFIGQGKVAGYFN